MILVFEIVLAAAAALYLLSLAANWSQWRKEQPTRRVTPRALLGFAASCFGGLVSISLAVLAMCFIIPAANRRKVGHSGVTICWSNIFLPPAMRQYLR